MFLEHFQDFDLFFNKKSDPPIKTSHYDFDLNIQRITKIKITSKSFAPAF